MSDKPTYEELEKRIKVLEHTELERQKAERDLAQIFAMSLDMICIADINEAIFIKVNPAFTNILGYAEEDLLEKPFFDFIHMEDIEATRDVLEQMLQRGAKVINFENRYRCKDGSYRWLSWVSHPNTEKGLTFAVARDITERKQNEEALKKSKELLEATGRMARVGGWELDANTLEVTWTEETYRIHEVPLDNTPSLQEAINFFHPEDRQRLSRAIQRALDHGEPYDMEIRFITARGKHLWTRSICRPVVADGKTVRLMGIFQDITDRKIAEEALKGSEKALKGSERQIRMLLDSTAEGILGMDLNGSCTMANPAAVYLLGYQHADELIGENLHERIHQARSGGFACSKIDCSVRDSIQSGKRTHTDEEVFCRSDGSCFPVEFWSHPILENDQQVGLVITFTDISERKKSEELLLKSEEHFKMLYEKAPLPYQSLDEDGIIVAVNQAWLDVLGYQRDEVIGRNFGDFLDRKWMLHFKTNFPIVKAVDEVLGVEFTMVRKDGSLVLVAFSGKIREDETDHLHQTHYILNDITERRRIEEALVRSNEELEYRVKERTAELEIVNTKLTKQIELLRFAEKARSETANKMESLIYAIGEVVYEHKVPEDIFLWSGNVESLLGYSEHEMGGDGDSWLSKVHPDDLTAVRAAFYSATKENHYFDMTYRFRTKSGEYLWMHDRGRMSMSEEGELLSVIGVMKDISQRRRAEEYTRRQAQIIDQIHDSVFVMDLDGNITSWNKGSENLFQYTSGEAIGRPQSFIYPDASHEWLQTAIIPDLLAHKSLEIETKLVRKDGQVFDALVSLSVLKDRKDNIDGMIGYYIDISDRKQIERELQASEAKFRVLFDIAPIPLAYVGNTGTVIDINAKFTQVFGYTRTDIPTWDDWSMRAYPEPAYRRWVIVKQETLLRKSQDEGIDIDPIEYQVTSRNGEVRHMITSYTALEQDSFLAAFVDITDLRRAEEAERRSNKLYREITKQSGEGINIADLEGNYVSVNPAFCRMTGYSEAELLGMNVKDLVPSGMKMSLFPKVVRGEQGLRETELVRKDGSHFVAEVQGYPLALDNQNLAFANIRDISERIQAEEQIKASLKEKEALLKEVHHRVKNNLAVIISLLNLQAHQLKDENIATALHDSRDRVKSMALIHESLYQSKDIAEISLKEYAPKLGNRLLQAMTGKAGQIRIVYAIEDIRLDIDHAIPCGLILNELLTNTLKYAFPEGNGEVRVAAHYTETDEIELVVQDNGIGLPEGLDIGNIESLGLNIVSTLTENQLEGTLDIRNQNGAGFAIRWPLPTDKGRKAS